MKLSTGDSGASVIQRLALSVTAGLVRVLPSGLLRSLARSMALHDASLLTRAVTTSQRQLNAATLPSTINGFEDLTFLFWTTPMNRGILRQDFDEAALLYRTIRSYSATARGVEIGRYAGGSTILIAAALAAGPGGFVTSVDRAPQDDDALRHALQQLALDHFVRLVVADANAVEFDDELDFVFIDGDHSYDGARRDHLRWGERVRVGGHIVHHDMGCSRAHATRIADLARLQSDILKHQCRELVLSHEAGSLVVFERVSENWTAF